MGDDKWKYSKKSGGGGYEDRGGNKVEYGNIHYKSMDPILFWDGCMAVSSTTVKDVNVVTKYQMNLESKYF